MTQTAEKLPKASANTLPTVDLEVTNKALEELATRAANLPVDLKDADNYRENQDFINDSRSLNAKVKAKGKDLKDDANKWVKKVTAEQNRILDVISDNLTPVVERKKKYDDEVKAEAERKKKAEQARKDAHLANINGIRLLINKAQNQSSAEIEKVIAELESIVIDDSYEEFQKEAEDVYGDTDLALQRMLITTQTQEDADRKRAEEDERLRKDREALEAQRLENERIQKENERIAEENRKAAEKLEEKAAEPAPAVEQDPAPAEEKPAAHISPAIQKKVDEDNSVVAQARRNTLAAIQGVLLEGPPRSEETAERILSAIQANQIPNVKYDIF